MHNTEAVKPIQYLQISPQWIDSIPRKDVVRDVYLRLRQLRQFTYDDATRRRPKISIHRQLKSKVSRSSPRSQSHQARAFEASPSQTHVLSLFKFMPSYVEFLKIISACTLEFLQPKERGGGSEGQWVRGERRG